MKGGEIQTAVLYAIGEQCVLLGDLAEQLELERKQVGCAAAELVRKGYVERREPGCFALSLEGRSFMAAGRKFTTGPNGPLQVDRGPTKARLTIRQRAWNVMRIRGKFSVPDLQIAAVDGDDAAVQVTLRRFCRQLVKAGVLVQLAKKERGTALSSPGFNRYMLVKDLGPMVPSYRRGSRVLFDHNAQKELPNVA